MLLLTRLDKITVVKMTSPLSQFITGLHKNHSSQVFCAPSETRTYDLQFHEKAEIKVANVVSSLMGG